MASEFMIGSECADWWEKRNKEYHEELEQYVLANPGNFAVIVATTKATAADFAMTMWVDLARLGEGAAEGSVKGVVQDIFRVMNFIPEAKVLQGSKTLFSRAVQFLSNLRFWRKVGGELCVPIAIGQAMQRGGHAIGVSLAEIADALGTPLIGIFKHGADFSAVEGALVKLGLQVTKIEGAAYKTFDALKKLASESSGPILLRVHDAIHRGHAILIARTSTGVKIIDRAGVFDNLTDLSRRYHLGPNGPWQIDTRWILSIPNAEVAEDLLKLVKDMDVLACLVRQSVAVFDINFSRISKEALDADFEKFLASRGSKRIQGPETVIVGGFTVEVTQGDPKTSTLSGIAKAQYGDFNLWPLIYDLNKEKIGPNPNRLKAGTKLMLLPLETYTAAELAAARRRAPGWKDFPRT